MERRIQSYGEHLKPATLYRDDIEKIVEALREISPTIKLSSDEYHFADLKELCESKKDFFTHLEIESENPYISAGFHRNKIWLFIYQDTPQSRGTFEKIKRIINHRARLPLWVISILGTLSAAISGGICLFWFLLRVFQNKWTSPTIIYGVFLIVCILWTWWMLYTLFYRYSIIIPKYRIEAPGFWKRNSDKVILVIISAVIGSLLTLLIKNLTGKQP
jgi:hypothetical protein